MPRIDYAEPSDDVARRMRERRGGALTPLDGLLSHNDGIAEGWNALLGAVRDRSGLQGDLREMVILRIAWLNRAPYEWDAHLPLARREGISEDVLRALRKERPTTGRRTHDAVLRYTDAMTSEVTVPDAVFGALPEYFDDTSIAELTATIAAYNMVSRFLVALDVQTADRVLGPDAPSAQN